MCVIAIKKLEKYGWVGVKNRDRNYKCDIQIIQSNRNDIQRLYIDDTTSRWTEGINEFGVSILSASFAVKSDEKEAGKIISKTKNKKGKRFTQGYYAPDGKTIRVALFEKTPEAAAKILIERELSGATIIFNNNEAYLLEGGFTVKLKNASKENPREYIHKLVKLKDDDVIVRSNHGVLLPQLGYKKNTDDEYYKRARLSSDVRYEVALKEIKKENVLEPSDILNGISVSPNKDKFLNPIRTGNTEKKEMVTTGQLMIVPSDMTLHYRPLYSSVHFKYDKLNGPDAKTFFEIISSRKLLSFKEWTLTK
jgi:hypothetical protein